MIPAGTRPRAASIAAAFAMVFVGAFASPALGATLANGVYTAAPGERNLVQVIYEPSSATYRFLHAPVPEDADGPGGCYVEDFTARCPAAGISKLVIDTGDGEDLVSIGPGGVIPTIGGPGGFGTSYSDANQPTIPAEIHTGSQEDMVSGGWGADTIDTGAGPDLIIGFEDSFLGMRPSGGLQAPDSLSCGTGADFDSRPGGLTEDNVYMGPNDTVGIDCEAIQQQFVCPPDGPACRGVAPVEATVPVGGKAASTSGSKRARTRTVVLGSGKFNVNPGQMGQVLTRLRARKIRSVVKGKPVPARSTLLVRKKSKTKTLKRTRFKLAKRG